MTDWISTVTLTKWIYAFLLLVIGFIPAKKLANVSERYATKRFSKHHAALMKNLFFYLIIIAFLISALQQLGFKLTVLIGAAGVLSVVLSFASQTAVSNLMSGIFMIFEQPFKVIP